MTLRAETQRADGFVAALGETLQAITKLKGGSNSSRPAACRTTARSSPTSARWGNGGE